MTLKRFIKHLFSACALLVAASAALAEVPDPVELLALSDQSRWWTAGAALDGGHR